MPNLGLGPVFTFERIIAARRWQVYALRSLFVTALLAGMTLIWWGQVAGKSGIVSIRAQAEIGQGYFYALIGTQLALVMLAAPAFTAGSICLDRSRGMLTHMLMTDLSDPEIVLGKLGARLLPVVSLIACALPVLSLSTLLGGMDPLALALAFLITSSLALLGCTLALTISVWAKKTHDVLMATYAIWVILLLLQPVWQMVAITGGIVAGPPSWVLHLNPFWLAFAAYMAPNQVSGIDYALFFAVTLGTSLLLVIVAVARMRAVTLRDNERAIRRTPRTGLSWIGRFRRSLPGPTLDGNPVLWREWHRNQPSRLSRLIWLSLVLGTTIGGSWSMVDMIRNGVKPPAGPELGVFVVILQTTLGLLLLSVSAATSLAEERARGSLDVLLATPLSTWSIVWGKWWGAFRVVPLLAFWPGVIAVVLTFSRHNPLPAGWPLNYYHTPGTAAKLFCTALMIATVLVHGAAITSLGLALATWIPKQGRAVSLCVAAYVIVCVGWIVLIMAVFSHGPGRLAEGLAMLSPVFASGCLYEGLVLGQPHSYEIRIWASFWVIVVGASAVILFVSTYLTFDDCLGRISDWHDLPGSWDDPDSNSLKVFRSEEVFINNVKLK